MKLKICNVKNYYETKSVAELGVNYVGFHLISESDYAREEDIIKCLRELREAYPDTKSILVTKERSEAKLSELIRQYEFDGVQLHYEDSTAQITHLRREFGEQLIIIQVITPSLEIKVNDVADVILIDQSFVGGTGIESDFERLKDVISGINKGKSEIFVAGGITLQNIDNYLKLPIAGIDIQSGVRTGDKKSISYSKSKEVASLCQCKSTLSFGQVGFAIQSIYQENMEVLNAVLNNFVDFLHIDLSDGFVSNPTDLDITKELIDQIVKKNPNVLIQIHFFYKDEVSLRDSEQQLEKFNCYNIQKFLHLNRHNYKEFGEDVVQKYYIAFDVKDILMDNIPWERLLTEKVILCLPSQSHMARQHDTEKAIKIIQYTRPVSIYLDRQIDINTILSLGDRSQLNIISGTYLRQNIKDNFILLKLLLQHD